MAETTLPINQIPSYLTEPAQYKEVQLTKGLWNIYPKFNKSNLKLIGSLTQGSDAQIVQRGSGITVYIESAQASIFLQATCPKDTTCDGVYSNTFFFDLAPFGSGGGGGAPTGSYTFVPPFVEAGGTVSIALSQSLQITQSRLDLNLNADPVFKNALTQIGEALRIADYTSVGRVMPLQGHFQLNALTGELSLDLSPTGALAQNFASPTDLQAIDQKVTANTQNIARHDNEIADLDQQINLLETGKADVADLQALEQKVDTNTQDITQAKGDITALEGRVTTNEGNITTNTQDIQSLRGDLTTLSNGVVKTGNVNQDIDGVKNFLKGLEALALQLRENAVNAGALDINNSQGYISISQTTQGILQLLAGLGFIDGTTTFRIRNLAGGLVTFNTLAQYEQTFTPTDDKDLVHLAYVKQVKAELLALIQQSQGGLTLIGNIPNTKAEVEANYTLLDNFVQQETGRPKQKGDFIITSDRWGFVYNGTNWVNFGQVSIVIATTTQAGLMMFGTNAGELEDIGGGKAKVIGWDTVTQALTDLDRRISANATNIQQIQTSLRDYARLGADNTFTGNNTFSGNSDFTGGFKIQSGNNPAFELKDTGGNKSCIIQTIDSGQNLQFTLPSGGAVQFNGTLRYPWNAIPTVTNDNDIPPYKQIKDEFATIANLNLKANDSDVVKLTGDQIVEGNKSLRGVTTLSTTLRMGYGGSTVIISPEDDSAKTLRFRDTSVGTSNQFNLDLENVCGLTGIKDPTSARDAVPRDWANNQYIPKVTTTATNGIQVTSNAQKAFNFDYVWDDNQAAYRNWSGIKLRCKTQSASAFTDMFYLEYRETDNLGIFMTCVSNKLTFGNPTKVKGVSCEDADSADTATSKGWIQTNYKKAVIIPVGGSLPAQTASDTIYYVEV